MKIVDFYAINIYKVGVRAIANFLLQCDMWYVKKRSDIETKGEGGRRMKIHVK